jgi:hypothetical protein
MPSNKPYGWILTIALGLLMPVGFCFTASADEKSPNTASNEQRCRKFVKDFYVWYENLDDSPRKEVPLKQAIQSRSNSFSPPLLSGLKSDIKAQSLNPGELVGLDFDPIFNAQLNAKPYDVGTVTVKNGRYLVEVYGTWNGKKGTKPDVIPELSLSNGKWIFENFHYQKEQPSTDLLKVLKQLRDERKTFAKKR